MKHKLEALCVTQEKTLSTVVGQVFAPLCTPHLLVKGIFTAHKQSPVPHCVPLQAACKASPFRAAGQGLGRARLHHPNHTISSKIRTSQSLAGPKEAWLCGLGPLFATAHTY